MSGPCYSVVCDDSSERCEQADWKIKGSPSGSIRTSLVTCTMMPSRGGFLQGQSQRLEREVRGGLLVHKHGSFAIGLGKSWACGSFRRQYGETGRRETSDPSLATFSRRIWSL